MKAKRTILFFFLFLSALIPIPLIRADPGWLTGWTKRVKITIDSGDVDTALSDFPVLIYVSDSSGINGEDITFVFDEVGANSLKIAVTLSDGITECYTEIEKWDLGNEKAWLWAKISAISNITDTDIYLYYDNDHADNTDKVGPTNSVPAENVWDTNYDGVYHLKESSTPVIDSTINDFDLTAHGNPTYQQAGKIDGAIGFDGDADSFDRDNLLAAGLTGVSVEAWIEADTFPVLPGGIIFYHGDNAQFQLKIFSPDTFRFGVYFPVATWILVDDDPYVVDTQYHVAGTWLKNDFIRLYVNGVEVETTAVPNEFLIDPGTAYNPSIGAFSFNNVPSQEFDGIIDELRISSITRSPSWIKTTYETGRDDLLDFESEQEAPQPYIPTKLFGAGFNSSSPYVILRWASNLTDIDFFEIQNSTDKISWDYLGQSTTNQYTDLQVTNGLERYYRVRACNLEYGEWFNSTFTDINFEKVYFVIGSGGLFPGLAIGISLIIIAVMYFLETRR